MQAAVFTSTLLLECVRAIQGLTRLAASMLQCIVRTVQMVLFHYSQLDNFFFLL